MSLLRRIEAIEPFYPPPFFSSSDYSSSFSSSIFAPQTLIYPPLPHETEETFFAVDHIAHSPYAHPTPLELFDAATDLIQIPPQCFMSYKRLYRRFAPGDPCIDLLCDRFDHLVMCDGGCGDRKYKWMVEIEGKRIDQKYKWMAEIKEKEREKEKHYHHHRHYRHRHSYHHHHYQCYDPDLGCYHYYCDHGKEGRSYKWTAEIEEKGVEGPFKRMYTWQTTIGEEGKEKKKEKKKEKNQKKKKKEDCRLVEIVEPNDYRAVILRQRLDDLVLDYELE